MNLNPYRTMKDILKKAKNIIFASGTLKPLEEFTYCYEFAKKGGDEEVNVFSCGHIIQDSQVIWIPISSYRNDEEDCMYNFQYNNRENKVQIKALGKYLIDLANIVKDSSKSKHK